MSKKILILTPLDRETMTNILLDFKEEFRTFPIEVQAPVLIADLIYESMEKTNQRSYFQCFLAAIDSYKNMNQEENVFLTSAPIKIMLGASSKDILYHEIWVYDINVTSTQEDYIEYYMEEYGDELKKYIDLYKSTQATRRFKNFKSLTAAISKELSKEKDNEL